MFNRKKLRAAQAQIEQLKADNKRTTAKLLGDNSRLSIYLETAKNTLYSVRSSMFEDMLNMLSRENFTPENIKTIRQLAIAPKGYVYLNYKTPTQGALSVQKVRDLTKTASNFTQDNVDWDQVEVLAVLANCSTYVDLYTRFPILIAIRIKDMLDSGDANKFEHLKNVREMLYYKDWESFKAARVKSIRGFSKLCKRDLGAPATVIFQLIREYFA